jgi:hypothetical protein
MTYIVEIFLPLRDQTGAAFPEAFYAQEKARLLARFGGLTAYSRAPAQGLWTSGQGIAVDAIIVFEVMAQSLDVRWWRDYRRELEALFAQEQIVIRATSAKLL